MATRTIDFDRSDLDKSIEVLSSAAQALQLRRFEKISYRALIVSVDLIAVGAYAFAFLVVLNFPFDAEFSWKLRDILFVVFIVTWVAGFFIGIIALVLNIPLFRRVFRERARLKKLGLSSLSRSLWKERRRGRWISRTHGTLLIVGAILLLLFFGFTLITIETDPNSEKILLSFFILVYCVGASVIIAARYLRNQRERMNLTADAEELMKAFQGLILRADSDHVRT